MRVLSVIDTLGQGGAETLLCHLAPSLAEAGVDNEVAVLGPPYTLGPLLRERGAVVHELDQVVPGGLPGALLKLLQTARAGKYDVIHAHLFFSALAVAALPRRLAPAPRICSLHNVDFDVFPARTAISRARKRAYGWILRNRFDSTVSVSRAVAEHFDEHVGLTGGAVIYNAIPAQSLASRGRSRSETRFAHDIPPSAPMVISVGRFVPQKGHRLLIEAFSRLVALNPDALLVIVGRGPLESVYREDARRLGISASVRILPSMDNSALMALVAAADIFAMPSRAEGFGIAVAEAMALDVPVVASRLAPLEEFIEHKTTGLLVTPGEVSAFARALQDCLDLPLEARRRAERARRFVIANLDVSVVAGRWRAFYERQARGVSDG